MFSRSLRISFNCETTSPDETNVCFNCLDLNILKGLNNKIAIHEIDSQGEIESYTYDKLFKIVNNFSGLLKNNFDRRIKKVMIHSSA